MTGSAVFTARPRSRQPKVPCRQSDCMNVKIGMNMLLWGTRIDSTHIPVFAQLREAGYDGVEIPVTGQPVVELEKMAAACEDLGLQRTASAFVGDDVNPISTIASLDLEPDFSAANRL